MPKKYVVIWEDTKNGIKKQHGYFISRDEAFRSIQMWWKDHDFEPYYIRTWDSGEEFGNELTIDYGFHYYFYKIITVDESEVKEYIKQFPIIPKKSSMGNIRFDKEGTKSVAKIIKNLLHEAKIDIKNFYNTF